MPPRARGDEAEFNRLRTLVAEKKSEVAALAAEADQFDRELRDLLMALPNLPLDEVPDGADEDGNVEIRRWGNPRNFDFTPLEHFDIAGVKPGMDFETAAKLSGARFVVLKGAVIRVHRALSQFMLDTHIEEHGLHETWTPVLVKEDAMYGTNQLPKFAEDSYQTTNGWWLIPTSEVTLTNTRRGRGAGRSRPADPHDRAHPMLPFRSGQRGQGHLAACCASTSSKRSRW